MKYHPIAENRSKYKEAICDTCERGGANKQREAKKGVSQQHMHGEIQPRLVRSCFEREVRERLGCPSNRMSPDYSGSRSHIIPKPFKKGIVRAEYC